MVHLKGGSSLTAVRASLENAQRSGRHISPDPQDFAACPSDSVDYAIMEREQRVACVPVDMGWSDVGSWDSLYAISAKDAGGNVVRGQALALGARAVFVRSESIGIPTGQVF